MLLFSCQEKSKKFVEPKPSLSILDSIANTHGYANWSKIDSIRFTFNVVRAQGYKRTWIWDVRKQEVTSIFEGDTVRYLRATVDSTLAQVDAQFINDKYWLLVPFNLIWDRDNFKYEVQNHAISPISGDTLRKLTIVYGDIGGYTPGDAYDFYISTDLRIKEWAWRKGNDSIARLITSWSDPKDFNGILISDTHFGIEAEPRIHLSDIKVY